MNDSKAPARQPVALISVTQKQGIVEFARELVTLGFRIMSTGGTAKVLKAEGIEVIMVESIVGKELGGDLVKTLSREISSGLLLPDTEETHEELKKMNAPFIDLVCVDLYKLDEAIAAGADRATVIKNTDVGGPNMLHAGAKGRRIVVSDPQDRNRVIDWLKAGRPLEDEFVGALCAKADWVAGRHLVASATYHGEGAYLSVTVEHVQTLRYGENAHQAPARLYRKTGEQHPLSIINFAQVMGELPSFINLSDIDRLRETVQRIYLGYRANEIAMWPYIAVAGKHGNLCGGAAVGTSVEAIQKALDGDPISVFGGTIMVNFEVGEAEAQIIRHYNVEDGPDGQPTKRVVDNVVAPSFTPDALALLKRAHGKCRLFVNPALALDRKKVEGIDENFKLPGGTVVRDFLGGMIEQPRSQYVLDFADPRMECSGFLEEYIRDLVLAWAIGSSSNSNTITVVKGGMLLANGVGQQNRMFAACLVRMIAGKLGHDLKYAVAYSDSFFPFPDGPMELVEAGIKFIFASRGSRRDEEVKNAITSRGVGFATLPDAVCRGFYGH